MRMTLLKLDIEPSSLDSAWSRLNDLRDPRGGESPECSSREQCMERQGTRQRSLPPAAPIAYHESRMVTPQPTPGRPAPSKEASKGGAERRRWARAPSELPITVTTPAGTSEARVRD